jgi:hypothetical protein
MKNILSIIILTFLFVSCNQRQSEKLSYALADREGEFIPVTQQGDMNSTSPLPPVNNQHVIKKKIIKDGQLRIQVADLENSKSRIDTLVKNHGGYYDKESFNNTDRESMYYLKIRVPYANFEILINDIETGKGEIKYRKLTQEK